MHKRNSSFLSVVTLVLQACGPSQSAAPPAEPNQQAVAHQHADHAMVAPMPESEAQPDHQHPTAAESATMVGAGVAGAASLATVGATPASHSDAKATLASESVGTAPSPSTTVKLFGTVTAASAAAAKHAVVYLENAPIAKVVDGTMDNRRMAFVPHVVTITAGAKVTFKNSDPFPHNVFSADNERWDMGVIPAGGTRQKKFDRPGIYTALCNMHPNMKAYIVVMPTSYFAKVELSG
ncbi:MAG TPA: plastocyanin/azurin family copper-binding protein, partial [Polyangiaceae bacterium]